MGAEEYDFVSLEGYLSAKVFHHALAGVSGDVTTAALRNALESMTKYDAGGVEVAFGKDDHRGMDTVYMTKIDKSGDTIKFTYIDTLSPIKK